MIIASINGQPVGLGRTSLGEATFVKGTNFNCNASICFGIREAHDVLKQLQQAINSFATLARFTPITVDGFIGAGTVNAGSLAARVARGQGAGGDSPLLAQLATGMTKEQIATNAPGLLAALTAANRVLASQPGAPVTALAPAAAPATAPTPAPAAPTATADPGANKIVDFVKSFFQPSASPTPGGFAPTPAAATTPGAPATATALVPVAQKAKVPLWVWIFAGVGGVIVLGGIGYAIFHKPAPAPAAAAPPPTAKAVGGRRARRYRRCRYED